MHFHLLSFLLLVKDIQRRLNNEVFTVDILRSKLHLCLKFEQIVNLVLRLASESQSKVDHIQLEKMKCESLLKFEQKTLLLEHTPTTYTF
jgi:hypothetical protein